MRKNGNGYTSHFNKYKNHRTEIDGIVFASKKEAQYYVDLKERLLKEDIRCFERQVEYELIPPYENAEGKKIKAMKYVADFVYMDKSGKEHIIDVKGLVTDVFRLKKKVFEWRYPTKVIEVVK
jgi:hypothetical protein